MRKSSKAKSQPLNKGNVSTDTDEVRLTGSSASIELPPNATKICLYRGPESDAVDPFYTLPIGEAGQTQFLIYHCKFPFYSVEIVQSGRNIESETK
jgi:hypothetical protein